MQNTAHMPRNYVNTKSMQYEYRVKFENLD
jgi:hypothetical protein